MLPSSWVALLNNCPDSLLLFARLFIESWGLERDQVHSAFANLPPVPLQLVNVKLPRLLFVELIAATSKSHVAGIQQYIQATPSER